MHVISNYTYQQAINSNKGSYGSFNGFYGGASVNQDKG